MPGDGVSPAGSGARSREQGRGRADETGLMTGETKGGQSRSLHGLDRYLPLTTERGRDLGLGPPLFTTPGSNPTATITEAWNLGPPDP